MLFRAAGRPARRASCAPLARTALPRPTGSHAVSVSQLPAFSTYRVIVDLDQRRISFPGSRKNRDGTACVGVISRRALKRSLRAQFSRSVYRTMAGDRAVITAGRDRRAAGTAAGVNRPSCVARLWGTSRNRSGGGVEAHAGAPRRDGVVARTTWHARGLMTIAPPVVEAADR